MNEKILVFSGSRADYGLLKEIITILKKKSNLFFVCGPQHFSKTFNYTYKEIINDKLKIDFKINSIVKKTDTKEIIDIVSSSLLETNKYLKKIKPKIAIVLGDRYETFSFALCCYLNNIKIAHIHGGEITEGSFDEGLRHSITKMSDLHFVSHPEHKKIIKQLGENKKEIFNYGAPGAENAFKMLNKLNKNKIKSSSQKIIVTYHPETKNSKNDILIIKNIFKLVKKFKNYSFYFTSSNSDTGGSTINSMINNFCKINKKNAKNLKSLGHKNFLINLSQAKLLIGNSSSSIIEGSTLSIPAINIGIRQKGRVKSNNILNSNYDFKSLVKTFKKGIKLDARKIKKIFLKKNTSLNISNEIIKFIKDKKRYNEIKKFYKFKK